MKKIISLIMTISILGAMVPTVMADNTIELEAPIVCDWADNKKAAVSITIDDGDYESAVEYNKLLKKYGIHATQFLIPGRVESASSSVISGWKTIFSEGYMDIGNHSYNHKLKYNTSTYTQEELEKDITGSQHRIKEIFPGNDVFCFATPWGQTPDNVVTELQKGHYANRLASGGVVTTKTPSNFYKIPTYAVKYGTTVATLNSKVDSAITNGGWYVELNHGLGEEGTSDSTYLSNPENVEEHFNYIKTKSDAGDVWAGSFNEVVRYIYERNSATVETVKAEEKSMVINLTDTMSDNELFDYPLTVKVNVPQTWTNKVTVAQNEDTKTSEIVSENGKNYIYVNIVPDSGEVTLYTNESTFGLIDYNEGSVAVNIPEAGSYIVLFVDYEGSLFSNVSFVPVTVTEAKVEIVTNTADFDLSKGDKVMLWQDLISIKPLCPALIIE